MITIGEEEQYGSALLAAIYCVKNEIKRIEEGLQDGNLDGEKSAQESDSAVQLYKYLGALEELYLKFQKRDGGPKLH
jgi:hypothetical protein